MRKSAPLFCALLLSLSARRAWIEIAQRGKYHGYSAVALRKESVDRNYGDGQEKRAITIAKIGKDIDIIEHDGRVVYYSVAPSSNCTFNQYFVGDCLDSVWPENVEGVYYDN